MANNLVNAGIKRYLSMPIQKLYVNSKFMLLYNPGQVEFSKHGEIMVRTVKAGKWGDYDKTTGFKNESATEITWTNYPCRYDRSSDTIIDGIDEFMSFAEGMPNSIDLAIEDAWGRHLSAEFDAVCASSLYSEIPEGNKVDLTTGVTDWGKALASIKKKLTNAGVSGDAFLYVNATAYSELEAWVLSRTFLLSPQKITITIPIGFKDQDGRYTEGLDIQVDVVKYNRFYIIEVPDDRMYTEVDLNDTDGSGSSGGYAPGVSAKQIYMMCIPTKNAAFAGVQHSMNQIALPMGFPYTDSDIKALREYSNNMFGGTITGSIGINQKANAFESHGRVIYDAHLLEPNKDCVFAWTVPKEYTGVDDELTPAA